MRDGSAYRAGDAGAADNIVIRLRQRADADIAGCVQLLADVHAADGYPTRWPADPPQWLTPSSFLAAWVVEREHALLGHIALCGAEEDSADPIWAKASGFPPDHLAEVARLFVAPSARGQGLGATLLAEACAEAHRRGLRPALKVLGHNQGAIALYERTGWRHVAAVQAPWAAPGSAAALLHYYIAPD